MKLRVTRAIVLSTGIGGLLVSSATSHAQTFVSGSTGADGAFNPTCAPTPCTVTVPLPASGIFNFTTINVATGVTVKFTRNAANTPVTMLASGNVALAGVLDVSGTSGVENIPGRGGPGGFDGGLGGAGFGASSNGSPGLGPGGGQGGTVAVGTSNPGSASSGSYGAPPPSFQPGVPDGPTYGVHTLFPLIGGSGGGGGVSGATSSGPAGGGGGGAILIASSGTITITGTILARGGDGEIKLVGLQPNTNVYAGCGSGGGIRIIANTIDSVASGGVVNASGGSSCWSDGGDGRIRVETFQLLGTISYAPSSPSFGLPGPVLPSASSPKVLITSIGGQSVPPTPQATYFSAPDVTVNPSTPNPIPVQLLANNVPLGTVLAVSVVSEGVATRTTVNSTPLTGTLASSTATANVTLPPGTSVLTAMALFAAP